MPRSWPAVVLCALVVFLGSSGCGGGGGGGGAVFVVVSSPPPRRPPVFYSITPNRGPRGGNTAVTIQGANFDPGRTIIRLNGLELGNLGFPNTFTAVGNTPPLPAGTNPSGTLQIEVAGFSTLTIPNAFGYILQIQDGAPLAADRFGGTTRQVSSAAANGTIDLPGRALAIGDFNMDGRPDLAVGLPGRTGGAGQVDVFIADAAGQFSTPPNTTLTQATPGAEAGANFGFALAAGDFIGADGFPDLLIGAPGATGGGIANAGEVFIRQGNGTGGFLAEVVLGNPSAVAGGEFGFAVALGNFDGATDASLEILVGEPDDPAGGTTRGSFHVYNAPPPAFSETVLGAANGESQGASVATGNLNPGADAFDDFLIGIPGVDDGGVRRGRFGRSLSDGTAGPFGGALVTFPATFFENNANFGFPIATGNYDQVSGADLLVGQHLADPFALVDAGRAEAVFSNGAGGFAASTVLFEPVTEAGAWFGFAVSTGDINFDGFRDAYVGAPRGTGSGAMALAGEVHLFRFVGGITFVFHETLRELVPEAGANFGFGVAAADLSNDGLADVVIANPGAAGGGGEVFIYYQPR